MKIRAYFNTILFSIFFLLIILVSAAGAANTIMPLGNSITRGVAGSTDDTGYRRSLYFTLIGNGFTVDFVGSLSDGIPVDFDRNHEGHGGFTADQVAAQVYGWLTLNPASIVLLHIGTNGLTVSPDDVETILDEIDRYENDNAVTIWVILAFIINRSCITDLPSSCPESVTTTNFNANVATMADDRIIFEGDKIRIVDMENGDVNVAVIDYHLTSDIPPGDMADDLHPFDTGYAKMADLWFDSLMQILPQADAGPDQNVDEFETVTLDALASTDPKNGTLSYLWVQAAGTPVVLSDDTSVQPTFDAPDAGLTGETLTFTLTVTDEDELVSTDDVNVNVAKIVPQANAGPDQTVNEFDTVTLDASNSVGVGLTYQWTQTAGTVVSLSDAQAVQPTFTAPDVGPSGETLTFELTVTDDDGIDSTDAVNVAVENIVEANAGPNQTVNESATVTLDASNSVGVGLTYQWTQEPGGTVVSLSDAQAVRPTFTAPDVGSDGETLTFRLTITDANNLEDTATVNINVRNPNSSDGGGGGGGGGGCFITTSGYGSSMALGGNISLVAPPGTPAATLELVVAKIAFISICAAIVLHRRRKRWIKPLYL